MKTIIKTSKINIMKKSISFLAVLLTLIIAQSFTPRSAIENKETVLADGKAYWFSFYNNGTNKKLYISQVYNNDCNHCSNEITADFKKWLILNDYENTVSTQNINNLQDVDESTLESRREAIIIRYKGYGYSIVSVNFKYTEK
ncbi:MAG: hypothetical protein WC389_08620 [Lutibacter sp.]|jgi:hypothetical protein